MKSNEIAAMLKSRTLLFSKMFTRIAPVTLRIGRMIRMSACGGMLSFGLCCCLLFGSLKEIRVPPIRTKPLRAMVKGMEDSGAVMPNSGLSSLTNSPAIIRKAMLSPTERRMVSGLVRLLSFSSFRIMSPGMNVR